MTSTKVSPVLVAKMTAFYGTIEAARKAYREMLTALKAGQFRRCNVLVVESDGSIGAAASGDMLYTGSVDAYRVLPS